MAKAPDTPHDASGFELYGGPVSLTSECCLTNVDDGAGRAVRLFCSSVAPRPSVLASQCRRNGRELSIAASHRRKTSIGEEANSVRRAQTVSSMEGVKLNVTPFLRRAVVGRTRLARLGRNLR